MADEEKKDKKIIVDEDWKTQAQKEKEQLAAEEQAQKEKKTVGEGEAGPIPEASLAGLISMLATQAFFAMGVLKIEGEAQREPDLGMAKYNIDMLGVLEEKTKDNRTEEEDKMIQEALGQARMLFVQISQGGQ